MTILVTGATGHIGRHLVTQLVDAGQRVRALSRNPATADLPAPVDVVAGDLADVATLRPALDGVDAIHLITFAGADDLTNGDQIVGLLESFGVVRASVLGGWAPTSVEQALANSSIAWARLEPVEVMVNTFDWADEVRNHRTVSTLGTWPSAMVHEADIAAVALRVLTEDGHDRRRYGLTGPEALTPQQRVAILGEVLGEPIEHVQLTEDQERARLAAHGFGEDFVEFGMCLALAPPAGAGVVQDTVREVTGRPARTFRDWAQKNASHFRAGMSR